MQLEYQARKLRIQVEHLDREMLTDLLGHSHHQDVALRCQGFPYADEDALLSRGAEAIAPLLLLDSIQDPQNLGALLRSGCFLGAKGVLVPKDRAAAVTATVIKVAAGAASLIPVVQVTNLVRTIKKMKDKAKEVADACKGDAEKVCKDVKPGEGRILKCLKQHETELSPSCKEQLTQPRGKH